MLSGRLGLVRTDTLSTLAHDGGWDEILLIVGPMAAIAALLVIAKRRVDAAAASLEGDATADDTDEDPDAEAGSETDGTASNTSS